MHERKLAAPLVRARKKDQHIASGAATPFAFAFAFDQYFDDLIVQAGTALGGDDFLLPFEFNPPELFQPVGDSHGGVFFHGARSRAWHAVA